MAKVDLARSKNRSMSIVNEIIAHEIFKVMFSEKYLGTATQQTTSIRHIRTMVESIKESVDKFLMRG